MKGQTITKLSAVIITIVLVAILLSQISTEDVVKTILSIEPTYLVIGFILYLCTYFFRALRFHILLNNKISIKDLFLIMCVHNMANNILPARTGEISYVYLSKKLHNISLGEGVATLMVARVFDFITISFLFFVAVMTSKDLSDIITNAIWVIAGLLIIVVLMLFYFVYFGEKILYVCIKIIQRLGLGQKRGAQYLLRKTNETAQSFETMKSKRVVVWTGFVSILIWVSAYSMDYTLIYAFGIDLSVSKIMIIASFSALLPLLPFHGIGGFGTTEATLAVTMIAVGVSNNLAIVASFGLHIIGIGYVLILGIYGFHTLR